MAMSRKKALEILASRAANIEEHLQQMASQPDHSAMEHWKHEVENWLRDMRRAVRHAGKKTAAHWEETIAAFIARLEDF